ncbi:MAG TPA: GNAT family N-acetyltransferase [Acidimicrobiales bacterium]|nr:GNAT family N-acetyltransferase [Acidimicrobiales bacterium]
MKVSLVSSVSPELDELWRRAHRDVVAKRGGPALLKTLGDTGHEGDLLAALVTSSSFWIATEKGELKGFGILRGGVVEAIYVSPESRRQKVATALVKTLLASDTPPLDAYALPGDRAMKSLYESLGWKARLLTMRGVSPGDE